MATQKQPKRGEGPFILELSDGCSALSIPYRWLTKKLTGIAKKLSFLDHCIEHDEAYWYGGSASQRRSADDRLFWGVWKAGKGKNIGWKCVYGVLACGMWVIPRIVGSPKLPTPFRWMRREKYSPVLAYTVEDVKKDSTVQTVSDADSVMKILESPNTFPQTVEEAVSEFKEFCDISEQMDKLFKN